MFIFLYSVCTNLWCDTSVDIFQKIISFKLFSFFSLHLAKTEIWNVAMIFLFLLLYSMTLKYAKFNNNRFQTWQWEGFELADRLTRAGKYKGPWFFHRTLKSFLFTQLKQTAVLLSVRIIILDVPRGRRMRGRVGWMLCQ